MSRRPRRAVPSVLPATVAAGGLALIAEQALLFRPPGGAMRWERRNHAGRQVSLVSGPALTAAAALVAAVAAPDSRTRAAAVVAGLVSGAVGAYDDAVGSRPEQAGSKGLGGHLSRLRHGHLTTGAIKVVGIGAAGIAAGLLVSTDRGRWDVTVTAGLVAGTANVVNLLDLRPGRALKAVLLVGVPLLSGPSGALAAGPVGAAIGLLPGDLAGRTMLGDAGANAAGALLGLAIATRPAGRGRRAAVLAAIAAATATSEVVSFTRVIAGTPPLRWLDELGRPSVAAS